MTELRIGERLIGEDAPAYIIAEGGANHGCDIDVALKMVEEAAAAGADAIKFQTYKANTLTTRWAPRYWDDPEPSGTQYAVFENWDDLSYDDYERLFAAAKDIGIEWLTTPFDLEVVEWMADLGVAAYKIASADLTNWPLLRAAAQKGKPMLLSSGGSTLDELRASIEEVRCVGNDQIILLHCILCYPAPVEEMNLRSIPTLKQEFPEVIVGLSDHNIADPCVTVPAAAVALGAKVIEKHFTLDTGQQGIDHQLAVDPPMLKTMIENIRNVEAALGSNEVRVLACEEPARQYARRSVVAAEDIPPGTVIEPQHLIMKRPGTGVSPTQTALMLGRKTIRAIEADQLVTWADLDGEVPKA